MKGLRVVNQNSHFHIVQVGCGANGSHFFRSLLQDIKTYEEGSRQKFTTKITLVDADKIEKKNLKNQIFMEDEVGEFKCRALAERYGDHYGFTIGAVPSYVTSIEMLQQLFTPHRDEEDVVPVLISMVDNNASRQLFDEYFHSDSVPDLIYIDAGVEGVTMIERPSAAERDMIENSGFGGQVVVGLKRRGKIWLEPAARVFPNILEDQDTAFPGASCGTAIINNPQRCATNKFAAQISNGVMNTLFHTGTIYTHVINFNAQFGGSRPTFINKALLQAFELELTNKGEN